MQNTRPKNNPKPSKDGEEGVQRQAMQLTTAIALPMTLKAAIDLGLLEIMQKGGPDVRLSPSEIASRLVPNTNNQLSRISDMTDRILRLLSSYSIVCCHEAENGEFERLYSLGPVSRYFLPSRDDQGSLAPMFNMIHDKFMVDVWYNMKDAILEDKVALVKTYNMSPQEAIMKDERFSPMFFQALTDFNHLFINKILNEYNGFNGIQSLVDVGGGNGSILKAIISKYPTIKGILFDLPSIIHKQPAYPGIQHVAGDMLTSIPKGDAIFMKWVLKNLDDEKCLQVLKNCFEALEDGGKLMIVELVIPEILDNNTNTRNQSVYQFDLYLTNMNVDGKERTAKEFQNLVKVVGFSSIQSMVSSYDLTLLEFHKCVTK
ncbi:unnamed protein product [Amaranthus hypochondriacus]